MTDQATPAGRTRSQQVLASVLVKLAVLAFSAVASIVITRALGPTGRGDYFVIVTVAIAAQSLGHLSLEQAGISFFSRGVAAPVTLGTTVTAVGLVSGVVAAAAAFGIVLLVGSEAMPVSNYIYLVIALFGVPTGIMVIGAGSQLLLRGEVPTVNAGKLSAAAVQCVGLIAFGLAGRLTVAAVVVLWVVGTAFPLTVYLARLRPHLSQVDVNLGRRVAATGAKYHAGMASLFLLWRVDVFILNGLATPHEVGLYSLAVTLVELTYFMTEAVSQAVISGQAGATMGDAAAFTARVGRSNFLFAALLLAGTVLASPIAIPIVFGGEFWGSVMPLVVLAPGVTGIAVARALLPYLVRLERPLAVSAVAFAALAVNVALNLALIPEMGIVGASLASSIAYGVLALAFVVWFLRSSSLPIRELWPRPGADAIRPLVLAVRS